MESVETSGLCCRGPGMTPRPSQPALFTDAVSRLLPVAVPPPHTSGRWHGTHWDPVSVSTETNSTKDTNVA
ncbi:unnamed protein product [Gulo gulo]|uniref:Uncharacterized protein n=1 Tax=Gulo gulo TaxID=48420 RepID=A0A9X9LFY9_GULGU|nr:unnamed protein product [Gulo gulo]